MSAIDELAKLRTLVGMPEGDAAENTVAQDALTYLDSCQMAVETFISKPGLGGESGQAAVSQAQRISTTIDSILGRLAAWQQAQQAARCAMRIAASHADDPDLHPPDPACTPTSPKMTQADVQAAFAAAAAAHAAAEAKAQTYLDQMNQNIAAIKPKAGINGGSPSSSSGGRAAGTSLPTGIGWSGLGGSGPYASFSFDPSVYQTDLSTFSHHDFGVGTFGDSAGSGQANGDATASPGISVGGVIAGAAVAGGLLGAAAIAAAVASGAGGIGALSGLGSAGLGVAPPGGLLSAPGTGPSGAAGATGMMPGMAGGGAAGNKPDRKRIGYIVQRIDGPADQVDPGWGFGAGSAADLPPAAGAEDDAW